MVYLVKLWVNYACLDKPKGLYLVKWRGLYLVKGRCFYLVKGFCPIFGVDIAFFAISFFWRFSHAFSKKTNVRLDVHRFDADCLAKGLYRACVLAFVGHLMEYQKTK